MKMDLKLRNGLCYNCFLFPVICSRNSVSKRSKYEATVVLFSKPFLGQMQIQTIICANKNATISDYSKFDFFFQGLEVLKPLKSKPSKQIQLRVQNKQLQFPFLPPISPRPLQPTQFISGLQVRNDLNHLIMDLKSKQIQLMEICFK